MRITADRMVGVLGAAPKPAKVWQEQFDYCQEVLVRLAQADWDKVNEGDFSYYFLDLAYSDLQLDLFRHVFPACLKYWYDTLMRDDWAGEFHYALAQGQILEKMLSPQERESLLEFFRDGFLDRIETEHDFTRDRRNKANAWIFRFNALGTAVPAIQRIWDSWWRLDHPGKAVSAVMYASGFVYLPGENPIFGAWTEDAGPGGPYLAWTGRHDWQNENVTFLRTTLSAGYVVQKLEDAARALAGSPDAAMADQVANDAKTRTDIIEMRIVDLVDDLSGVRRNAWR
jgi:hypothetical protein